MSNMDRIQKISMITSLLGLWFTSFFSSEVQIVIGFILIFAFGILHGANDLIIIGCLNQENDNKSFLKILISYAFFVICTAILFVLIPSLALLTFILISGYHFGEQHWQKMNESIFRKNKILFFLNYGVFILLLLFSFHEVEVQMIIQNITNYSIPIYLFKQLLYLFAITLLIQLFWLVYLFNFSLKTVLLQLLYIILFAVIFKVASLIWGFTIYFIMWHSIPSLNDQIQFLYGKYTFENFISYLKSALIYWILSLLGIGMFYFLLKDEKIFDAIFFSFLAAITFPHAFVISKMFKKHKKTG